METQSPPAAAMTTPPRTSDAYLSPPAPNTVRSSLQSSRSPRISPFPAAVHLPDVEKAAPSQSGADDDWTLYDPDLDPDKDEYIAANSRALSILLYLSGPCFLLSLLAAVWTLAALLVSTLLLPLTLLRPRCLRANLTFLLAPALRLHLAAIHSPPPPSPSSEADAPALSPLALTTVLLLSPLVATAVALAAWTAGFFWFFACVVGNPEGPPDEEQRKARRSRRGRRARRGGEEGLRLHQRADDGRASVLCVRGWWKAWLASSYDDGRL